MNMQRTIRASRPSLGKLFKTLPRHGFDNENGFEINATDPANTRDTLTLAYLMHPEFATQTVDEWVDVDMGFSINNGKATSYARSLSESLQKITNVKRFTTRTSSISMSTCAHGPCQ